MAPAQRDFDLHNHGPVCILVPLTVSAQAWSDENLENPETQHWGNGVVIELRYVADIVDGLTAGGLTLT